MEWRNDPLVMDSLSLFLKNQKPDLGKLLETLHDHNDGSPLFQFLQIYGMFVFRYSDHLKVQTESDALGLTLADISNHPTVQNMVAGMVQAQIDRGMKLD